MSLQIELFNFGRSFTKILNPALIQGNYTMQPLLSSEGINSDDGKLLTIGFPTIAGTGYANGVFTVAALGGSGFGATLQLTFAGGSMTAFTIINGGKGYKAGDIFSIDNLSHTAPASITVLTVKVTGSVSFTQNGDLTIKGGAGDPVITISSITYPYKSLLDMSAFQPFIIKLIRLSVTTDSQLNNGINLFRNTHFNNIESNQVSPRQFFNPNQFQGKIVDIPLNYLIDSESGLLYIIEAGETVKMNMLVQDKITGQQKNIDLSIIST